MSSLPVNEEAGFMCPSARCEEGSYLLGIVGADGVVGFILPPLPLDAAFVEQAHKGRSPESRFRFTNRCVESNCGFWTGSRCGVIDNVVETLPVQRAESLRPCMIRSQCRWFSQHGRSACDVCPLIVTEARPDRFEHATP